MLALVVMSVIFLYIVIGSALFRVAMEKHLESHNHSSVSYCFSGYWCAQATQALWFNGMLWPLSIPIAAGWFVGGARQALSKDARDTNRRTRELAEATHRVAVAKRIEEENTILDRQLSRN